MAKGKKNDIKVEDADIRAFKGVPSEQAKKISKEANINIGLADGEDNKIVIGKLKMSAVDVKKAKK